MSGRNSAHCPINKNLSPWARPVHGERPINLTKAKFSKEAQQQSTAGGDADTEQGKL